MVNWKEKYELNKLITEYDKILEIAEEINIATEETDFTLSLISIKDLLLNHFRNEESFMREISYHGFIEHKKNHDIILSKLDRILLSSINNEGYHHIVKRFLNYLIQRHFMGLDRKLNNYIQSISFLKKNDSNSDRKFMAM